MPGIGRAIKSGSDQGGVKTRSARRSQVESIQLQEGASRDTIKAGCWMDCIEEKCG